MKGPVLVTGASGLLGRQVRAHLESSGEQVMGLSYSRRGVGLQCLDLTDEKSVKTFLSEAKPRTLVHCAAERRPDLVEGRPDEVKKINVTACETLADYVKAEQARIVYLSTDYVFDGNSPPYQTDAQTNPLNAYGVSKLEGEKVFMEKVPDLSVILRVPILYGPVETIDESQVTTLAELVKSGMNSKVDDWATRYPTYTPDVARAIGDLLNAWEAGTNLSGIQHFSGSEAITKYGMCLEMAKIFGCSSEALSPDPNPPAGAPRPKNSQLGKSALDGHLTFRPTPFFEGLKISLSGT